MNQPDPQATRATGWALLTTLVVGLLVALFWRNMPDPIPASSSPERFSAERAQSVIAEIARAPHPVGSQENERVRTYLRRQAARFS